MPAKLQKKYSKMKEKHTRFLENLYAACLAKENILTIFNPDLQAYIIKHFNEIIQILPQFFADKRPQKGANKETSHAAWMVCYCLQLTTTQVAAGGLNADFMKNIQQLIKLSNHYLVQSSLDPLKRLMNGTLAEDQYFREYRDLEAKIMILVGNAATITQFIIEEFRLNDDASPTHALVNFPATLLGTLFLLKTTADPRAEKLESDLDVLVNSLLGTFPSDARLTGIRASLTDIQRTGIKTPTPRTRFLNELHLLETGQLDQQAPKTLKQALKLCRDLSALLDNNTNSQKSIDEAKLYPQVIECLSACRIFNLANPLGDNELKLALTNVLRLIVTNKTMIPQESTNICDQIIRAILKDRFKIAIVASQRAPKPAASASTSSTSIAASTAEATAVEPTTPTAPAAPAVEPIATIESVLVATPAAIVESVAEEPTSIEEQSAEASTEQSKPAVAEPAEYKEEIEALTKELAQQQANVDHVVQQGQQEMEELNNAHQAQVAKLMAAIERKHAELKAAQAEKATQVSLQKEENQKQFSALQSKLHRELKEKQKQVEEQPSVDDINREFELASQESNQSHLATMQALEERCQTARRDADEARVKADAKTQQAQARFASAQEEAKVKIAQLQAEKEAQLQRLTVRNDAQEQALLQEQAEAMHNIAEMFQRLSKAETEKHQARLAERKANFNNAKSASLLHAQLALAQQQANQNLEFQKLDEELQAEQDALPAVPSQAQLDVANAEFSARMQARIETHHQEMIRRNNCENERRAQNYHEELAHRYAGTVLFSHLPLPTRFDIPDGLVRDLLLLANVARVEMYIAGSYAQNRTCRFPIVGTEEVTLVANIDPACLPAEIARCFNWNGQYFARDGVKLICNRWTPSVVDSSTSFEQTALLNFYQILKHWGIVPNVLSIDGDIFEIKDPCPRPIMPGFDLHRRASNSPTASIASPVSASVDEGSYEVARARSGRAPA